MGQGAPQRATAPEAGGRALPTRDRVTASYGRARIGLHGELSLMGLLRSSVNREIPRARGRRRAARGAWYPDPFEVGDERWWDGGQWTREVRNAAEAESPPAESPPVSPERPTNQASIGGSRRAEATPEPGPPEPRASGFPVRIEAVVGEQLRIVPSLRKPGMHCQVLAGRGRVGSISVFGRETARLVCAHGAWFVKKSRRTTRGFRIESADHKQAGSYLRHQWLSGGTISLTDGTEVELRRSLPGRWKVRSADGSGCVAEVHRSGLRSVQRQELKVTIHSLPADAAHASLLILAACALLMLPDDAS